MNSNRMKSEGTSAVKVIVKTLEPEDFLCANARVSATSLDVLKKIYDLTKVSENIKYHDNSLDLLTDSLKTILKKQKKKKQQRVTAVISKAEAPLSTLITEGFDESQIWEEIELQNGILYENLVTSAAKLLAYRAKLTANRSLSGNDSNTDQSDTNETEVLHFQNIQDVEHDEESEDSNFFQSDRIKKAVDAVEGRRYSKSVVDDRFFSLAQMTEHLENVEAEIEQLENKKVVATKGNLQEAESSGDESVDLFEDVPCDAEGDEKEPNSGFPTTNYYYQDFFDPPLDTFDKNQELIESEENESGEANQLPSFDNRKSVRFNLKAAKGGLGLEVEDKDINEPHSKNKKLSDQIKETLSTFEQRNKKIEENIREIENEALEPKSWQLLGESTAESRPENALLEEHLVYDHLIKPAPEITVETTLKLEDVIKKRIKDGAWDDVQRKAKPIENPREYKKRLVMEAEQSKVGLADIYEQEYLDKKMSDEGEVKEKEPEEQIQIKKELQSLFAKLDAISHYHYSPKPPSAEVKIVTNVPAFSIDDVAPVSVSHASMLAPQEIIDNTKGPIKGKEERTETDRKRERRKKKKKQHLKRLRHEENARSKGLGLRNIKLAETIVKSKNSNDTSTNQYTKELKSSKAFFAKLQESVSTQISNVAKRKKTQMQTTEEISAKKFKL